MPPLLLEPKQRLKPKLIQRLTPYSSTYSKAVDANAETITPNHAYQLPKKLVKHSTRMSAILLTKRSVAMKQNNIVKLFTRRRLLTRRNKNATLLIKKNANQITIMERRAKRSPKRNVHTKTCRNIIMYQRKSVPIILFQNATKYLNNIVRRNHTRNVKTSITTNLERKPTENAKRNTSTM